MPIPVESAESAGMETPNQVILAHLQGERPMVEAWSAMADTLAGRVHVEWDASAPVTPFGQLPFFIDYLKQAGLFDAWVADCPLSLTSPNAPSKLDLLGTVMVSVLAGHRRYAHITTLRCDAVNPPLLGMRKVVSEDSVRRGLATIGQTKGLPWLQSHLDYCTTPLLGEPWVLDMDSTVKTLYGHQEGAEVGYNPHKPGRPSHAYHTYMLSNLRLVLRVDVLPGDEYNVAHATDGLWTLLDHLGPSRWPALLRGDKSWGIERVMARAEQTDLAYLFRLRMTANVKRSRERAMQQSDWADAGQGWQGKETSLSGASAKSKQLVPQSGVDDGGKAERRPVMTLRVRDLHEGEAEELARITRSRTLGAGLVRRAQIVQHAVDGLSAPEIAAGLDLCEASVRFWLKRF